MFKTAYETAKTKKKSDVTTFQKSKEDQHINFIVSFLSVATYCEQSNTKSVDISGRYSHLNQTNKEKRTGKKQFDVIRTNRYIFLYIECTTR